MLAPLGLSELESGYATLPPAPSDQGRLRLIVKRKTDGSRDLPQSAELSLVEGLVGDRWFAKANRDPNAQITVMRRDVAELIANGRPLSLFGDNLFVDLDISADNLPIGSQLKIGACLLEVTPEPHTGCSLFKSRFGADALRFTAQKSFRTHRLRGVHFRVLAAGTIRCDDEIVVVTRGY